MSNEDDIVARLERLMCSEAGCGDMRIYMTAKLAAAEIQLLREENRQLSGDAGKLREERDEARREVCGLLVACHTDPDDDDKPDPNLKHIHAGIRGWDCYKNYINYKENTNG